MNLWVVEQIRFTLSPQSNFYEKKYSTAQRFIRKEVTSYKI